MNSLSQQYLFGLLFIAVGAYQIYQGDLLEFTLYALAGVAFFFNAFALEPRFARYKKQLGIITWLLIGATSIFFLYILQFKFL
jgi:hypothetical protein